MTTNLDKRRIWAFVAGFSAVAAVVALIAGLHFTAEVRLGNDRTVQATSVLAGLGAFTALAALAARRNEAIGLLGIAMASVASGAFWLMLGRHRFAGPVIMTVASEHGIHVGDPLALIPVAIGALVALRAIRVWQGPASSRRTGREA